MTELQTCRPRARPGRAYAGPPGGGTSGTALHRPPPPRILLARVRGLHPSQRVIVLSSSSDASRSLEARAAAAGALACLFKPLELDELIGAVEGALAAQPAAGRSR